MTGIAPRQASPVLRLHTYLYELCAGLRCRGRHRKQPVPTYELVYTEESSCRLHLACTGRHLRTELGTFWKFKFLKSEKH